MITAPTQAFYIIRASGEAAELITSVFSPGSMGDITDVVVLSKEYTNDIEPIHELDSTIETIKEGLGPNVNEIATYNPLFVPSKIEVLDDALEVEQKSDSVRFTAMNGNPFTVKMIELTSDEEPLLVGTVSYQQFDLPGYEAIMDSRKAHLN